MATGTKSVKRVLICAIATICPKSGYNKMRASDLKNPNPVVLSGGKAKQARCRSGITNFAVPSRSGSMRAARHGEPFWLHALLNSKTPTVNGVASCFPRRAFQE
jgi:hypothetical protein